MIVKPTIDINFNVSVYSYSTTYLYLVDADAPTTQKTINGQWRIKGDNSRDTGKLTAGKTYYIYGENNTNFCFREFTARPYSYTELETEIATATTLKATEGYDEGQDELQSAITTAQTVLDADGSTADDYAAAKTPLCEAEELFTAINTSNNTFSVGSSTDISDGRNMKSVYGITMTYHGSWTFQDKSDRGGNLIHANATYPTGATNNIPNDGAYLIFTPSVTGTLAINVNVYGGHGTWYLVDGNNGRLFKSVSGSNDYTNQKDFGTVYAGHTYYLYGLSCDWGYQFHSFTFTPCDNITTNYDLTSPEFVTASNTIRYVDGISMTYGGDTWETATRYDTYFTRCSTNATEVNKVPTAGTYVVFNPTVSGRLTISYVGFALSNTVKAYLSDGTNVETISRVEDGNGKKTDTFKTILQAGTTYYCYFSGGNYVTGFSGFAFEKLPETVSKAITSAGWATYCSPYPLDLEHATGLTDAYIVTGGADGVLAKTSVKGGTVPANTGLLIKGAAGTATIPVVASSSTSVSANKLVGVTSETVLDLDSNDDGTADQSVYVLMNDATNGLGFYLTTTTSFTVGANTAYLPSNFDGKSARSFFSLFNDEATSIKNLTPALSEGEGVVYNLRGQRVAQPTKGLYIVNGKKVVIK